MIKRSVGEREEKRKMETDYRMNGEVSYWKGAL